LTWRERLRLLWSGRIWHQILTFNQLVQPQQLSAWKPDMCDECARRREIADRAIPQTDWGKDKYRPLSGWHYTADKRNVERD